MKYFSWLALIISAIVVIYELFQFGKSDLVWILLGLGVSVFLVALNQVGSK